MPCDAACRKIIINTMFMAALAPRLVERSDGRVQDAAVELTEAAQVHAEMLAAVGLTPSPEGFDGCHQAQQLVAWINTPYKGDEGKGRAELMQKWTADIWSSIADLAAGKMPG